MFTREIGREEKGQQGHVSRLEIETRKHAQSFRLQNTWLLSVDDGI